MDRSVRNARLDSLRALAAAGVIAQHVITGVAVPGRPLHDRAAQVLGPVSGIAVALFFALSGLLLAPSLRRQSGSVFLKRRFWRLAPLAYVVGLCLVVLPVHEDRGASAVVSHLTFTSIDTQHFLLGPTWTLDVEVVLTLVLLASFVVLGPLYARPRVLLLTGALLFAAGVVLNSALGLRGFAPPTAPLLACLPFFAGAAVSDVSVPRPRPTLAVSTLVLVVSIPVSLQVADRATALLDLSQVLVVVGVIGVLVSWSVSPPWLSWAGRRSFGLYLWHVPVLLVCLDLVHLRLTDSPVLVALDLLVVAAVTVLLSDLTFRLVEQPGIERGRRPSRWERSQT